MVMGLEQATYKEKLRIQLFGLKKEWLGRVIDIFFCMKDHCREKGVRLPRSAWKKGAETILTSWNKGNFKRMKGKNSAT